MNKQTIDKRKVYYIIGGFSVLCLYLVMFYGVTNRINHFRIVKAEQLFQKSLTEDSIEHKIINLIQSDSLQPTEDKKLEIIGLYLEMNDFTHAQSYLDNLNTQKGYITYAESALQMGYFDLAKINIDKFNDTGIKDELVIYWNIAANNDVESLKNLPSEPQTNLGRLLKAINTEDYSNFSNDYLFGRKINEITTKYPGKLRQQLEIANMLNIYNQPRLAIVIADKIPVKSNIIDIHTIKAYSYYLLSDYSSALKEQLLATGINPADIALYQKALEYSDLAQNVTESISIKDNIEYLQRIKGDTLN